jgi:cell wall-associated NlpC family hydrolase
MPTRLRSLLPAFALAAIVFGCTASGPLPLRDGAPGGWSGGLESAAATVALPEPMPNRPVSRRTASVPTLGERAATIALEAVGVPYRWGGASLESGFDCSGLVHWAYGQIGVELPHSSYALYGLGRGVARSRMEPGDLLFFSGLGHVGLYVGRGRMIHAPQSGSRVEVVALGRSYYRRSLVGARRMIRS